MVNLHLPKPHTLRSVVVPACLASVVVLAGCGASTPEQRIAEARQAYQNHNYHAAEVQLKTVLQDNPNQGDAWALLGHTSLSGGRYGDAVHQFRKAVDAGQPVESLNLALSQALIGDGQYQDALDRLKADPGMADDERATIASLRGDAYAALEQPDAASQAYNKALSIDSTSVPALRGLARLAIARNDLTSARESLNRAVAADNSDAQSLMLLGQVDYRTQRCDQARDHLSAALKGGNTLSGQQVQTGRALLADCQLRAGQEQAAQQNIDAVLATNQNNPFGNYLQALMDIRHGEYQQASNHVQAILNLDPQNLRSMMLMAWIRIVQGRPEAAQPFLTRVLDRAPDDITALRLQAGLLTAENEKQQAEELIENASQRNQDQPGVQEALSRVLAQLKQASDNPDVGANDVALQLDLARSLAQSGSPEAAKTIIGKIKPTSKSQKDEVQATSIEISLANNDTASAIDQARQWVDQNPNDAQAQRWLANSYIAAEQYDKADDVLEKAQRANGDDVSLARARAQLSVRQGNIGEAIDRLKSARKAHPDNVALTLSLANLYVRSGDNDQRIQILSDAFDSQPNESRLAKALAQAKLAGDQVDQAMTLIGQQLAAHDADPDWLQLKGAGQLLQGQTDAGIKTLLNAADLAPNRPALALDVVKAQLASGRNTQAIQQLKTIRQQSPDYWPAAGYLALAQASAGDTDAAMEQVQVLRDNGQAYSADVLAGDVMARANRSNEAAKAYSRAFDRQPSARLAVALFEARQSADQPNAGQSLQAWLDQSPGDTPIALRLANWYQSEKKDRQAINLYKQILEKHSDAVIALNNLAVLVASTDADQALNYARRAHEQAPSSAAVSDTLGWLLVQNDQVDQGIELLEEAESKAGESSAEIRFHLGAALAQRSRPEDKDRVRTLLESALSSGLSPDQTEQARKLLNQLG